MTTVMTMPMMSQLQEKMSSSARAQRRAWMEPMPSQINATASGTYMRDGRQDDGMIDRWRIRGLGRHHLPEQHQRHKQSDEAAEQQRQNAEDHQAGGTVLVGGQRSSLNGRDGVDWIRS